MNRSRYQTRCEALGAEDTATGIRTPALIPLGPENAAQWLWGGLWSRPGIRAAAKGMAVDV